MTLNEKVEQPVIVESFEVDETVEPVEFEPYFQTDVVTLPSGYLTISYEITIGDILVTFSILLVLATQIAKWIWQGVK